MKIKRIRAENFKSYKKVNIELNNLNFIIGGNASGKSNYVNILKFFNDIIYYGLDDAILLQGGIKYLFNSNGRKNGSISLYFEIDLTEEEKEISKIFTAEKSLYLPNMLNYTLKIKPNEKGEGYKISKEKIEIKFEQLQKNDENTFASNFYNLVSIASFA